VSIHAICASTDRRARAVAERLGIPRAFGDWRELIRDPQLDIVSISVPPLLQAEIAVAAAAAGKHILAEKPLATTTADARKMAESVREAHVVGAVDFEFREILAFLKARSLLGEGAIGRLRHVYLTWRVETLANREGKTSWKRELHLGGGTLNLFGSHALDFILWTFGAVRRISASAWTPEQGVADSRVEAWMETVDGVLVSMSLASDLPQGSGYRVEIYGDNGRLTLENCTSDYAAGFVLKLRRQGESLKELEVEALPEGTDGRIAATAGIVRRFLDAVETGGPASPSFEDGLQVQRLMDAIREADRVRTWQNLS
jgi:predicted dehydrogenase